MDLGATMLFLHAVRDSVVLWEFIHLFVCLFVLQNRVSQHSSDCLGIHPTEQTGLEFRDMPDSAF